MHNLREFVDCLLDGACFFENYFRKTTEYTLDQVIEFIITNKLEHLFISQSIVDYKDDFYLFYNQKENCYEVQEVERNVVFSTQKFTKLTDAIKEKIKMKAFVNLTIFRE